MMRLFLGAATSVSFVLVSMGQKIINKRLDGLTWDFFA